eukprot:766736-Prymnesium_polylepis.3
MPQVRAGVGRCASSRTFSASSFPHQHRSLKARNADCGLNTMCRTAFAPHCPAATPAHVSRTITVHRLRNAFGALRRTAASHVS